jgi:signal transduction histidine kinase
MQVGGKILGGLIGLMGVVGIVIAPFIGEAVSPTLWGVEPLAYIGAVLIIAGLGITSLSYIIPEVIARRSRHVGPAEGTVQNWSQVTQQYFDLFDHDLGRPLRRILGEARELHAILRGSDTPTDPAVIKLLDEVERQGPNFRLMMSNIQVLVQLEDPNAPVQLQAVEPSEVVRRIVDRYASVFSESGKQISWWSEPTEFGIVYADSSAIEHIVTNLVDNAVRFASCHVEIKLTKNPSHFFVRVWDDGSGIADQYIQHIFDRGWTPEVARREEKYSSGIGLFIARTLAKRYGGELTVESIALPNASHYTAFLLSLPLGERQQ